MQPSEGFRSRVSEADVLVHPQDDRERDLLDGDGVADFAGGFAAAAALLGNEPELYHLDTSQPAEPQGAAHRRGDRPRRARPAHQSALAGRHAGARPSRRRRDRPGVDALYAFAATAGVPGHLFDATHAALIADDAVLAAMLQKNPAAAAAIAARLQDALARGLWITRRNAVDHELQPPDDGGRPMNAVTEVKGWCPGVLRPMPSGDGLIVRVRPWGGAFSLERRAALADIAERLGNGHIDLTRRANLQIRGLTEDRLPELQTRAGDARAARSRCRDRGGAQHHGGSARRPRSRAAFDVRPIALAIDDALTSDKRLRALPAKFGLLVDGGGALSIAAERADICLAAVGDALAFGLDTAEGTHWLGTLPLAQAAEAAIAAAHAFLAVAARGRMRGLSDAASPTCRPPSRRACRRITRLPPPADAGSACWRRGRHRRAVRPPGSGPASPLVSWRPKPARPISVCRLARPLFRRARRTAAVFVLEEARDAGLIVDEDDPVLQVEACPGAPACTSSSVDTRGDARRLATIAAVHGCRAASTSRAAPRAARARCRRTWCWPARPAPTAWSATATARGPVERMIGVEEFATLFDGTQDD